MQSAVDPFFGPAVVCYSRSLAIEEGMLMDVTNRRAELASSSR